VDTTALLTAIAGGDATGSTLAVRFGVSRTMVWKGVSSLRAEGLGIEGAAGEGYRLVDPVGFGQATLEWRCGRRVEYFERCGSTNIEAHQRAIREPGESGGLLVVADGQDAGRGRLGRSWEAEGGANLLFSLVLCPAVVPQRAASCVLAWAAAMAHVLDLRVKWPNDLVTDSGAKVGGILAQLQAEAERVQFVVLGVGLNVNQTEFPSLPDASSLALLHGHPFDRAELLARLVTAIEAVDTRGAPDLDPWRSLSYTLGQRVRVGEIEGIASGLRDDGALLIDGQPVLAGDVELVAV